MHTVVAFIFALATSAHAGEKQEQFQHRFIPEWQATCQIPDHVLRLTFKSLRGDPAEDDMVASVQWDGGPPTSLSLKHALFVAEKVKSKVVGLCDNVTGVLLQTGNLLLLLRRDDRPSDDHLFAVLLDRKTGNALDVIDDLGAETDETTLVKDELGVRVRLVRKWLQTSPQQEPTPILEWARLAEVHGKLRIRWETATL